MGGVRTRIQIIAVPGAAEHAPTRKQLLDQVDGIVFVVDTQRDRIEENISSLEELREALASYGRASRRSRSSCSTTSGTSRIPTRWKSYTASSACDSVAAFEAVATSGTAVLQTLTTISKRVIRHLRERSDGDRGGSDRRESPHEHSASDLALSPHRCRPRRLPV